jgi:hypothetical protein
MIKNKLTWKLFLVIAACATLVLTLKISGIIASLAVCYLTDRHTSILDIGTKLNAKVLAVILLLISYVSVAFAIPFAGRLIRTGFATWLSNSTIFNMPIDRLALEFTGIQQSDHWIHARINSNASFQQFSQATYPAFLIGTNVALMFFSVALPLVFAERKKQGVKFQDMPQIQFFAGLFCFAWLIVAMEFSFVFFAANSRSFLMLAFNPYLPLALILLIVEYWGSKSTTE